jgi:hypothetical protein
MFKFIKRFIFFKEALRLENESQKANTIKETRKRFNLLLNQVQYQIRSHLFTCNDMFEFFF